MRPWHNIYKFSLVKKFMYLIFHFISCIILALILFPFYSYYSLLIFIFGFFIDFDHYFYDILRNKELNLINSYKKHMNKELIRKDQLHIFHTLEFIISFLLLTLSSENIYLLLLSMGLTLHLILDFIYEIYVVVIRKEEQKQTRTWSLTLWIIK